MATEVSIAREQIAGRGEGLDYRVEDRGHDTPCWVWCGTTLEEDGYGIYRGPRGRDLAHRVYWKAQFGPVPEEMVLDHLCRVSGCVRPAHLEPVHQSENVRRGANAKLTSTEVAHIKKAYAEGISQVALARHFGVHQSSISRIITGKQWGPANPYRKPCSVNGRGRLTRSDAEEMRTLRFREGWKINALVLWYGVSRAHVHKVLAGRCWA